MHSPCCPVLTSISHVTGDKRLDEWVPAGRVTTLLNAPSLGTELSSYNLLSTPSLAS